MISFDYFQRSPKINPRQKWSTPFSDLVHLRDDVRRGRGLFIVVWAPLAAGTATAHECRIYVPANGAFLTWEARHDAPDLSDAN
jgi:hypothetical protein